jgi:hypothetical protein
MVTGFPFVGREDVLGELREAGERAAAGRGGLVTLTGAAGAGKTRLAEEAAARAEGFRTVWTWCPPDAVEHALRPWSRLLRELVVDNGAAGGWSPRHRRCERCWPGRLQTGGQARNRARKRRG